MDIAPYIRPVANFPKPGVVFRDITPLLANPQAFQDLIDCLAQRYRDQNISKVAGIDARGFIIGAPLALALKAGFVPIRKLGKLPSKTISQTYALEYGRDCLEIHEDAIAKNERVLIMDDLLATGGTVLAAAQLIRRLAGEIVECAFVVELLDLGGRKRLMEEALNVYSICEF